MPLSVRRRVGCYRVCTPVPCTLTQATWSAPAAAEASAAEMSADCAGPFGAVSALERPFWHKQRVLSAQSDVAQALWLVQLPGPS